MSRAPSAGWLLTSLALSALVTSGCSGEHTSPLVSAIRGGALAPDDTNVVAVVNIAGGQCSGSLIAPRLVLTARHCIADTFVKDAPVICGETDFLNPDSPGAVFVVALPEITQEPDDYRALGEIVLPDGVDADLCGTDVALLVLKEPIAGVTPLEPRLDPAVAAGERYSAVGFGVDEDEAENPSGVRKRLDDLEIACSGDACGSRDIRSNEWVGTGGPCHGDSGGPALDADGRVIGVVSRGTDGCGEPVFGDVASRAGWLKEQAIRLANEDREPPPTWAPCDAEHPCATDPEEPEPQDDGLESSCSVTFGRRGTGATWLLLGLGAVTGWRRGRAARARDRAKS